MKTPRLPSLEIEAAIERWPIARPFTISRGSKTVAEVLRVTIRGEGAAGRGEGVPYSRYGESPAAALAALEAAAVDLREGRTPAMARLPACARNALDCALWDWRAKASGRPVWELLKLPPPGPVLTARTIALDDPAAMAEAAHEQRHLPLLKLKLGAPRHDAERIAAVRGAVPEARLLVDANEGWEWTDLLRLARVAADAGVELIEQPLAAGADAALADYDGPVPLCADESVHAAADLETAARRYRVVNIKLDKAGGLTPALELLRQARARGLDVMLGSMVATSLAIAPALLLAGAARWADLDGPLLLARDRQPGVNCDGAMLSLPPRGLWGTP